MLSKFAENNECDINQEDNIASIMVEDGAPLMVQIVRSLDAEDITVANMAVRQPTLDDVFLALTGRTAEEAATESEQDQD